MALIIPGELENTLSSPKQNKQLADRVATVKDTFANRTTISPERYSDIYGTLLGYASGTPIIVEYYNKMVSMVNKQTDDIDMSSMRHSAQISYHLIHDFEIKLEGAFAVEYDEETTETTITGTGLVYPGFKPKLGDMFLYQLSGQELGIFGITSLQRLSIQQGTYHKVAFKLFDFASNEMLTKMNTSVNEESYFSKEKFLRGDVSLLSSQDYLYMKDLSRYRDILVKYYFQKFYKNEYNSIFRADDIYDPYVIEFLSKRIEYTQTHKLPTQLYQILPNYDSSFWYLLDTDTHTEVSLLVKDYYVVLKGHGTWDAGINGLLNKQFVILDTHTTANFTVREIDIPTEVVETPYVFTTNFYSGITAAMTPFELVVHTAITQQTVAIPTLIDTYLKTFAALSDTNKFYFIPIYIYLIDLAVANIS